MTDHAALPLRPLPGDRPIYRADEGDAALFYTPGYLALVPAAQAHNFAQQVQADTPAAGPVARALQAYAASARARRDELAQRPYAPVCLTLYLNNECNLSCRYCYAQPGAAPAPRLDAAAVEAAAHLVAANCQQAGRPFTLVLHGGGEPTLNQAHADTLLDTVEAVAAAYGLACFRYVATNGVMSTTKARWLARRFDLVGISCDGPATIQNAQRPRRGGQASAPWVERTAGIVRAAGTGLHARVTITRASARQQPAIAHYLCNVLQPDEIHVEPVYRVGRGASQGLDDVSGYVAAFWQARAIARQYGVGWYGSGSRPDDIHGPYCHVFRDVLQLVPGGVATACFTTTDAAQVQAAAVAIGAAAGGQFVIDQARVQALQAALSPAPAACAGCFLRDHCVRTCPEACALHTDAPPDDFRCRVQRQLSSALLRETAAALRPQAQANGVAGQAITHHM